MKKSLIALLLLLLGGGGAIGIDKLGSAQSWNKFEKPTHSVAWSNTAASQPIAANYDRQFLYIEHIGTSTTPIYVWFNTSTDYVSLDGAREKAGIALYATSTTGNVKNSYEINLNNLYFGPVQIISAAASKISIIEK